MRGWRWVRRATTELYSSTLGRAKQRRRFVQIVATVDRHARLMYSHIELRSLSTNLRRAERPCGGCWGCSPQRCELDAASSRTLVSPTATGVSAVSTKAWLSPTACRRCCACGRHFFARQNTRTPKAVRVQQKIYQQSITCNNA